MIESSFNHVVSALYHPITTIFYTNNISLKYTKTLCLQSVPTLNALIDLDLRKGLRNEFHHDPTILALGKFNVLLESRRHGILVTSGEAAYVGLFCTLCTLLDGIIITLMTAHFQCHPQKYLECLLHIGTAARERRQRKHEGCVHDWHPRLAEEEIRVHPRCGGQTAGQCQLDLHALGRTRALQDVASQFFQRHGRDSNCRVGIAIDLSQYGPDGVVGRTPHDHVLILHASVDEGDGGVAYILGRQELGSPLRRQD